MAIQARHIGSYGLCVREDCVLLIRKARGPYAGLLDLPGGGIEHGESPAEALQREFAEETGLLPGKTHWLCEFSNLARYVNAAGEDEELHHLGYVWLVAIDQADTMKHGQDGQDSLGAAWYSLDALRACELSPIARTALKACGRDQ